MTEEDIAFRKYILDISCRGTTRFRDEDLSLLKNFTFAELEPLEADGLVVIDEDTLTLTDTGKHFLRNVCRAFDLHLLRNQTMEQGMTFSKAV